MIYPQKWVGSVDKDNKAGVAEFDIFGDKYVLNLSNFTDFQMVCKMLDLAHLDGKRFVKDQALRAVTRALLNIDKW